jgi:hypothetical protein
LYGSEDEAIQIANDSKYGLHAAVLGIDVETWEIYFDAPYDLMVFDEATLAPLLEPALPKTIR